MTSVNLDRTGDGIARVVERLLTEHPSVPGAAVALRGPNGETTAVARGVADPASGEPLTIDHAYRIASCTKTFVAATVVLEANPGRKSLSGLRGPLREVCEAEVAWFREMPLSSAIRSLGADDRNQIVLEIAIRYPQITARLSFTGRRLFGPQGRAYEHRAIVDAFILAHAAVAEAWRASGMEPPPVRSHL